MHKPAHICCEYEEINYFFEDQEDILVILMENRDIRFSEQLGCGDQRTYLAMI